MVKRFIRGFISRFTPYRKYVDQLGVFRCWKYAFYQRVLKINGNVPWPVNRNSIVSFSENIRVKDGVRSGKLFISPELYIQGINGIDFGENIWIAPGVKIISANHDYCDYTKHVKTDRIRIGDNCWIGANAIILPGVVLGDHVIVAAGSVVTKSFKDGNCVIAGVPARKVREIDEYKEVVKKYY